MLQQSEQQRILSILKELPPDKLHEVVDFAEYLKTKETTAKAKERPRHVTIPTFHLGRLEKSALDRDALYGEYLDRKPFAPAIRTITRSKISSPNMYRLKGGKMNWRGLFFTSLLY
ncbi:MAG: DUF2281 domain-containing protein [Deltaproteobacteria bacterium]|nr:DUF2281 domain-containing protein [Deltaproteobacteria bacterium]